MGSLAWIDRTGPVSLYVCISLSAAHEERCVIVCHVAYPSLELCNCHRWKTDRCSKYGEKSIVNGIVQKYKIVSLDSLLLVPVNRVPSQNNAIPQPPITCPKIKSALIPDVVTSLDIKTGKEQKWAD